MDDKKVKELYDKTSVFMQCVSLRGVTGIPLSFTNLNFLVLKQVHEDDTDAYMLIRPGSFLKRRKDARVGQGAAKRLKFEERAARSEEERNTEEVDFSNEDIQVAVQRLQDCCSDDNLKSLQKAFSKKDTNEKEIQVAVGIHLVKKLTGAVHGNNISRNVHCPCGCNDTVPVGEMWIGSSTSWHGQLDLLGGASLSLQKDDRAYETGEDDSEDGEGDNEGIEEESPGDRINVEIKQKPLGYISSKSQIIGQAIVYAWTEYNRHPNLSPFIPTMLVCSSGVFVPYIYNPKTDELLTLTHTLRFVESDQQSDNKFRHNIHLLWVFLNHRLFFMKNPKRVSEPFKSGFGDEMKLKNEIEKFKAMQSFSAKEIVVKRDRREIYQASELEYPIHVEI